MTTINHERKTSLLLQLIGESFYELQDFDVTNIAINDVILSNDGSHAKVYVTFFKDKERYFEKITKMAPFIRSVVAKSWKYKKLPELVFLIDTVEPSARKIEKILDNIKNQ
ncbi:Ribosome-binding factor A [Metamycoplasma arthritidis]|uniref:Ribosome-binding factor A n=1 Tax=Metamycoplasma arthritidis (strain 158L3-1) TaxID=243272 RepID=B3PNC5_META1|nr:30S ribosome-binding factor RbfA [Metamycoplasma arthritidis]ACF07527.1 ribosome-binding factor A [Metamycoplasma arthritidis 158L3-1]VEU79035.1 Ribosome-binding factor A [Metamycoplasma arthritidis]